MNRIERIDCARDPRVAGYRGVRDGDLMRSRGLFVAEGRLIVRRVVEHGGYRIESVLLNDAASCELAPTLERLGADVPSLVCDDDGLAAIAGFHVHRGCLALVHRPPPASVEALLAAAATLVVLEGVANPDNVGGIFRNAAAFGCGAVLLSPTCCDPFYRKAIRTSMGATLSVPFARVEADEWAGLVPRLRSAGFTSLALTPRTPSDALAACCQRLRGTRVAVIVGSEGAGLTPTVERAADLRARIPTTAGVDSLNLATATGIALYELRNSAADRP